MFFKTIPWPSLSSKMKQIDSRTKVASEHCDILKHHTSLMISFFLYLITLSAHNLCVCAQRDLDSSRDRVLCSIDGTTQKQTHR